MENYEIFRDRAAQLLAKKRYKEVLSLLKGIPSYDEMIRICYELLSLEAIAYAVDEFGEVLVMENRGEYERYY